jgi:hypothetical protein
MSSGLVARIYSPAGFILEAKAEQESADPGFHQGSFTVFVGSV